jgi:hypothetical protein
MGTPQSGHFRVKKTFVVEPDPAHTGFTRFYLALVRTQSAVHPAIGHFLVKKLLPLTHPSGPKPPACELDRTGETSLRSASTIFAPGLGLAAGTRDLPCLRFAAQYNRTRGSGGKHSATLLLFVPCQLAGYAGDSRVLL